MFRETCPLGGYDNLTGEVNHGRHSVVHELDALHASEYSSLDTHTE